MQCLREQGMRNSAGFAVLLLMPSCHRAYITYIYIYIYIYIYVVWLVSADGGRVNIATVVDVLKLSWMC